MNKKSRVSAYLIFLIVSLLAIAVVAALTVTATGPLDTAGQLVLVLADSHESSTAELRFFEKLNSNWVETINCPAVIGKNGAGWGIGLHDNKAAAGNDPLKREGDEKSPEGVFLILDSYGYQDDGVVDTGLEYTEVDSRWICCDDSASKHYNRVFDYRVKGIGDAELPSHEDMLRSDDLYKYTILIGHNYWEPVKDAGSCIFIHLWNGPESHTAGCTAIAEDDMVRLMKSLDAGKYPVMALLTRKNYQRLKDEWGLPEIEM